MDMKEIGFYLFMEEQEKKQQEAEEEHRKVNAEKNYYLAAGMATQLQKSDSK